MVAKTFEEHNFHGLLLPLIEANNKTQAYKNLLCWYFEDQIRIHYTKLVNAISKVIQNCSLPTKVKAVQLLLRLLANHPYQETELILSITINKLGALEKQIAIAVVYGIHNLLLRRPHLKNQVVDTCSELLFRPNQRSNTLYNCMLLLKDILFTKDDIPLVQKMVKLYFGFFKACTKKGEVDCNLMSILLRGINRALPFLTGSQGREGCKFLEEQLDLLYKMSHLVHFGISVQILNLLYQVLIAMDPNGPLCDRFVWLVASFIIFNYSDWLMYISYVTCSFHYDSCVHRYSCMYQYHIICYHYYTS